MARPAVIPGSAYALGFRGTAAVLDEQDKSLAGDWLRFTLFGLPLYQGYFREHPEHVEPYRAMTITAPPPAVPDVVLSREQMAAALAHAQALVAILGAPATSVGPTPAEPPAPPPARSWDVIWTEPWVAPRVRGWTRVESPPCNGVDQDDPGVIGQRTQFGVGDWSSLGSNNAKSMTGGELVVDDEQLTSGWALLSGPLFDHLRPIKAECMIDMQPDPGAWTGLAIWCGEGNYREVGVIERDGGLVGRMNAPCYVVELGAVPLGPQLFSIEYDPAKGWSASIGGAVVWSEPIGYKANRLLAPSNVGLWFVNQNAEDHHISGLVRAVVGPVTVYDKAAA